MKWSSSWAPDSAAGSGAQQVLAMGEYEQQQKGEEGQKKNTHTHTEMPPRSFRCARSTGVYIISIWRPFRRQRVASRRNGHLKDMPTVPAALPGAPPQHPLLSLTGVFFSGDEKRNNIKICVYVLLYFLSFLLFALVVIVVVAKGEWNGGDGWGRGICPLLTLICDSLRTFEGHALYRQISKLFACLRFAAVYYECLCDFDIVCVCVCMWGRADCILPPPPCRRGCSQANHIHLEQVPAPTAAKQNHFWSHAYNGDKFS